MDLSTDIAAFESRADELAKAYSGKFVVFQGGNFIGAFDTFENAAATAVKNFGRGPYLIRQVGAQQSSFPASVLYRAVA